MNRYLSNYAIYITYIIYILTFMTLPNSVFRDRENYQAYVDHLDDIIYSYAGEGLAIVFNEPLFLFINFILGKFMYSEYVPVFFVFFIITSYFIFLKKNSYNFFIFFLGLVSFFTISYTFHFQFVILRQAIASIIIIYSLIYVKDIKNILLLTLVTCFIHSSMFFILILLTLNYFLKNKDIKIRAAIISIFFFVGGFFVLNFAQSIGVRQVTTLMELDYSPNGGAFILWLCVLFYLIFFEKRKDNYLYDYAVLGLVVFLSLYFTNPIVGRLMCSFVPAVILILVQRFNYLNILVLFVLIIVYSFLILNGVLVENSLLVDGDSFFKYLNETLFLKEF